VRLSAFSVVPTIMRYERTTCYNRFIRWQRAGIWKSIMKALATGHDARVEMIDTSMVRVHQHAACISDGASQSVEAD
jgi:transposase